MDLLLVEGQQEALLLHLGLDGVGELLERRESFSEAGLRLGSYLASISRLTVEEDFAQLRNPRPVDVGVEPSLTIIP